jgi:uncharacterized SAM-binding protein YcdF (DUF218 family)
MRVRCLRKPRFAGRRRRACYSHPVKLAQRLLLIVLVLALSFGLVVFGTYVALPTHNTAATHFDAIVVLGTPARPDGTPSPEQRERVLEGVREYRAGVAPHLIMTGAAAHNQFVEAHVMAQFAVSQGVPSDAILEEGRAQNTIQNIFYSSQIMHGHGWTSAEIVSSPYHLGRTALILAAFDRHQPTLQIDWRTHAAAWPSEEGIATRAILYSVEAERCLYLRVFGFPSSRFLPATAQLPATAH